MPGRRKTRGIFPQTSFAESGTAAISTDIISCAIIALVRNFPKNLVPFYPFTVPLTSMTLFEPSCTPAAERQDPDFLIPPRNKKRRKKKYRPSKFFFQRSKIQACISDDNHQTDCCARSRLLPLHHRILSHRQSTGPCGRGSGTRYRAN
jgi:hypothetical protein